VNHKRGRAKKQRAGCLFCKPHKGNGVGRAAETVQDRRAVDVDQDIADYEIKGAEMRREWADAMYEELAEISDEWAWELW